METSTGAWQAFRMLQTGFVLLPTLAGLDKFFQALADWSRYVAPPVAQLLPLDVGVQLRLAGLIEIAAGVLVAVRPQLGSYVVACWLGGIIFNLLLLGGYYDIVLRDAGLLLGALALARLASSLPAPPDATLGLLPPEERLSRTQAAEPLLR